MTPKYKLHDYYLGVAIYKRLPKSGTHGGMWMARSTTFKTLGDAKRYLDYLKQNNVL